MSHLQKGYLQMLVERTAGESTPADDLQHARVLPEDELPGR